MANVQRICDLIGQEDYNIGRITLSVWERNSHLKNKQIKKKHSIFVAGKAEI